MNMTDALQPDLLPDSAKARTAAARFFVGIAQIAHATEERDPYTRPLFPLTLILEAEGLLAEGAPA